MKRQKLATKKKKQNRLFIPTEMQNKQLVVDTKNYVLNSSKLRTHKAVTTLGKQKMGKIENQQSYREHHCAEFTSFNYEIQL